MSNSFGLVLEYCMRIVPTLQRTAIDLLNWFATQWTIGTYTFTIFEFILGSGLVILLGFAILKFATSIVV